MYTNPLEFQPFVNTHGQQVGQHYQDANFTRRVWQRRLATQLGTLTKQIGSQFAKLRRWIEQQPSATRLANN